MNKYVKFLILLVVVLPLFFFSSCFFRAARSPETAGGKEGVWLEFKGEAGQKRMYRLEENEARIEKEERTERKAVYHLFEEVLEVAPEHYRLAVTAVVVEGEEGAGYVYHNGNGPSGDYTVEKWGSIYFDGVTKGVENNPITYDQVGDWNIFPVFPAKSLAEGEEWWGEVYLGKPVEEEFAEIFPVRFDLFYRGMEKAGGRDCARLEFELWGDKEDTLYDMNRYQRRVEGEGNLLFDPAAGVPVSYQKKVIFNNVEETKYSVEVGGAQVWMWRKNLEETREMEIILDLVEITNPPSE